MKENTGMMQKKSTEVILTLLVRSLSLLFFEGLSLGLAVWLMSHNRLSILRPYVLENRIIPVWRTDLLMSMAVGGAFWTLLVLLCSFKNKYPWHVILYKSALRAAPLLISGLIPLIFYWKLWIDRELVFFALVTLVALITPQLIKISLGSVSCRWWSFLELLSELFKTSKYTKSLPFILVVLGVVGYTAFFSYFAIAAHHNLRTMDYDMGIENNLMWNLTFKWLAGDPNTPLFKTTPFLGINSSTLGWHTTFIAFVLTPFYALYPSSENLLFLQSLLISATAIPLFLWARIYIQEWLAALLGIAYLFYSPVHGSNLYDFHWLNLGPFFIAMTLYLIEAKKDIWGAIFVILTLMVREDVAPAVAIIGTYFLLSGRRPRVGLILAFAGTAYFIFIKLIFMPHIAGHSAFVEAFKGLLPAGETSFVSVIKTVIGNPAYTLSTLFEQQKLIYMLHFLAPLIFLPLFTPWFILFFIPGFFFSLLSTGYPPFIQPTFQYTSHFSCYFFIATALAIYRMRTKPLKQIHVASYVATFIICSLACSQMFGAFFQQQHVRGGFGIFQFATSPDDIARRESVSALIKQIPPTAKVAATKMLNAQISSRADAYTIPLGIFDAEWLLIETPTVIYERPGFVNLFQEQDFGVVDIKPPYALLKKGFEKNQNNILVQMLGGQPQ